MSDIRNSTVRATILDRIARLTPEAQRQWGKMTVSQMVCHCTDQMRIALGEKAAADFGNFLHKTIIKYLVINVIRAPKGKIKTISELDQDREGTPPADFASDKQSLVAIIEKFVQRSETGTFTAHPVFGKMTNEEWGKLAYKHLDHHLEQFGV